MRRYYLSYSNYSYSMSKVFIPTIKKTISSYTSRLFIESTIVMKAKAKFWQKYLFYIRFGIENERNLFINEKIMNQNPIKRADFNA